MSSLQASYTGFDDSRRIAQGDLHMVVLAVKHAMAAGAAGPLLIFSDRTGSVVDIDFRGTDADVLDRLAPTTPDQPGPARRGRGRPRLGVVGREVTLLPRHWDWLASQPGGASVALRKLIDEARRTRAGVDAERQARDSAYRFASTMAGNMPGFEESMRALFAGDKTGFQKHAATWPKDIANHALQLAFPAANGDVKPDLKHEGEDKS